jgi:ParB family chromosome partitioning protein
MTIHTQTSNDTDTPQVLGTLEYLDPNQLGFEANIRDQVDLDKEFLDSLREHGVIVPITAIRSDDGHTLVREGQCRTLGARTVGLASVPVYVLNAADVDVDAQTVERIVHQIVANDQRTALTNDQRARAIQQMLDTGLSATKIARKLSLGRDDVKAAGAAAKSPTALDALASGQMDFTEAAALVEFEDDHQAVRRLLQVAGSPNFDHTVAQLRTERESAKLQAEAATSYAEQGYTVLQQRPHWDDMSCLSIRYLRTPEVRIQSRIRSSHGSSSLPERCAALSADRNSY